MAKSGVTVEGVPELRRQLRQFAPDLLREMNCRIGEVLDPIVAEARGFAKRAGRSSGGAIGGRSGLPLSRWNQSVARPGSRRSYATPQGKSGAKRWEYDRLRWDQNRVVAGIRASGQSPRMRGDTAFRGAWAIVNNDAAGAVYELMGSGPSNVNMVRNVRVTSGVSGKRLIWRAWNKRRGETWAPQKVVRIIRDIEAQFTARMAGGR